MQRVTFTTSIPHIISRLYLQKANHTSITSRFCVHGTLQINPWNFLTTNIPLIRERCISYNRKGNLLNSFSILNLVLLLIIVGVCVS